jgi:hypothetical protein
MDSYRGFEEDTAWAAPADDEPAIERPPEIGVDERRMHVRAYNYWVSLLDGRPYPSIADLKPERIGDFGPHSVLLDFTSDPADPEVAFLGPSLRAECELAVGAQRISQVPNRSLLSRLTDHYMQIIANRAPIGFEAEFVSHKGVNTLYRGILMPLSTDGNEIDFIYGVINWKELAGGAETVELAGEVDRAIAAAPAAGDLPVWADGPNAELPEPQHDGEGNDEAERDSRTLSLWPEGDPAEENREAAQLAEDAGLADRLGFARASAEQARAADQRSRAALYRALGNAYDFALAAAAQPGDYSELLADAGLKAQARAPMTPVVKLVFGAAYDKTRLTEFAAALSWARRNDLGAGNLPAALEGFAGGLKGVVAAERAARRPEAKPDGSAIRRQKLGAARPIATLSGAAFGADAPAGSFVLLVARSEGDGTVSIIAPALRDEKLIAGAIAKTAD